MGFYDDDRDRKPWLETPGEACESLYIGSRSLPAWECWRWEEGFFGRA